MLINVSPRVERLKARAKHCCCKYCGGKLHVRQIIFQTQVDARIELYCDQCQKIEYGVEKVIYASARAFVQETQFNHFEDMNDSEQRLQMNIAKVCIMTSWQLKFLGLLKDDGFTVPVHVNEYESDQCTTIDDSDLERLLEEAIQWRERSLMPED
jgi:hypothetical protein